MDSIRIVNEVHHKLDELSKMMMMCHCVHCLLPPLMSRFFNSAKLMDSNQSSFVVVPSSFRLYSACILYKFNAFLFIPIRTQMYACIWMDAAHQVTRSCFRWHLFSILEAIRLISKWCSLSQLQQRHCSRSPFFYPYSFILICLIDSIELDSNL